MVNPLLRSGSAVLTVLLSASVAWGQGAVGYQLESSSGNYLNHVISGSIDKDAWWGSLRAASGYEGATEVDQSWSLGLGGAAGSNLDLDATLGQTQDTALHISDYSLSMTGKLPQQLVAGLPVRLGVSWGYSDYNLRNSALADSSRLPDQYHWGLSTSLPMSEALSLSLESRWSWYTVDPVALAGQLLKRRRPMVNAAMGLADFASFEHRARVNWRNGNQWDWSLGASYGQTVLGQSRRSMDVGLEVPWGTATAVGLSVQHTQDDEVRRTNGLVAIPYQTSNSFSLSWNWKWN